MLPALKQSGAAAEYLALKDRGITGNGHFAMVETNRKEIFEVLRGWIESKLPAAETRPLGCRASGLARRATARPPPPSKGYGGSR